ncbi:hypothetical protein EVAR_28469_1 [Eumeta japonica]|uniref:Uncharacterized protein n=1 Tax=Eumeta variegata TaxID=151549 RepID=A0A4C1VAM7_EUMVA|nr:hypothetical protein EVAR_28469_1 [Eumeta japonica]
MQAQATDKNGYLYRIACLRKGPSLIHPVRTDTRVDECAVACAGGAGRAARAGRPFSRGGRTGPKLNYFTAAYRPSRCPGARSARAAGRAAFKAVRRSEDKVLLDLTVDTIRAFLTLCWCNYL